MGLWFLRIYCCIIALGGIQLWIFFGGCGAQLSGLNRVGCVIRLVVLTAGPISAFLASLLAGRRPAAAMAWLIFGAIIATIASLIGYGDADFLLAMSLIVSGPMLLGALVLIPRVCSHDYRQRTLNS